MCFDSITEDYEGFTIVLKAEKESEPPFEYVEFETKAQEEEYYSKINSGEIGWFCVVVECWRHDILLAQTSLGCCDYSDLDDFKDNSGYYQDLREEVTEEARKKLDSITISEVARRADSIYLIWTIEDVHEKAAEMEAELSDLQARNVLSNVLRSHDASVGVSWDTLECWIDIELEED